MMTFAGYLVYKGKLSYLVTVAVAVDSRPPARAAALRRHWNRRRHRNLHHLEILEGLALAPLLLQNRKTPQERDQRSGNQCEYGIKLILAGEHITLDQKSAKHH